MKLQNILWVPAVAIALGMVSLAEPGHGSAAGSSAQVNANASQPKAAEAVSTSDTDEGADVAATGESFATVALFTPGATAQAEGSASGPHRRPDGSDFNEWDRTNRRLRRGSDPSTRALPAADPAGWRITPDSGVAGR